MSRKEAVEIDKAETSQLSEDQIKRIFQYARMMLNIFRLSPKESATRKLLEQECERAKFDFTRERFIVMSAGLCFLRRSPNGSQFYLTEKYHLTPTHEQGFKSIIDGKVALKGETEYASGLVVDVYLGDFRSVNLVNFSRPVALSKEEEFIIKSRCKEEMPGHQVVIFQNPI